MSRLAIISALLSAVLTASAAGDLSTKGNVEFRTGSSAVDSTYRDNASQLTTLISAVRSAQSDPAATLTAVELCGFASPEGKEDFNWRMAQERRNALLNYLRERVAIPDSVVSLKAVLPFDWSLLATMVERDTLTPGRERVLELLSTPEGNVAQRLKAIEGGRTWNYMLNQHFPAMRNAYAIVVSTTKVQEPPQERQRQEEAPVAAPITTVTDTQATVPTPTVADTGAPLYWSLHTNALYDLLLLTPNLGAEVYLGKQWSVMANAMYGWWHWENFTDHYVRSYGGEIAVRRWFGRKAADKPLTGWHVGVYGQILAYDVKLGDTGRMGGKPGKTMGSSPSFAAGIELGFALPVARRLNIDFNVGIGYLGGTCYKYGVSEGKYVDLKDHSTDWFGPTKLEVSLVWLLGRGNENKRKGGER